MPTKKTALVLQGGAALGAYEYGVIRALNEHEIKPDIITGVSIGSFNAAVLAGAREKDPLKSLDKLWREIFTVSGWLGSILNLVPSDKLKKIIQLAGHPHIYAINPKLLLPFLPANSIYDTSRLRHSLEEVIDLDRLNSDDAPHVTVNAIDVLSGKLTHFDNKNGNRLTIDHLMASSSIAPLASATTIADQQGDKNYYWDGAFFNNTPLSRALQLLQSDEDSPADIERELIVAELFPRRSKQPPNDLENVTDRIIELLCSNKLESDLKHFSQTCTFIDLVQHLDKTLPNDEQGDQVRNHPGFQFLLTKRKRIDRCLTVTLQDKESVLGLLDFSKSAIERRIHSGYSDTVLSIQNSDF